jgi:hypothetical protein
MSSRNNLSTERRSDRKQVNRDVGRKLRLEQLFVVALYSSLTTTLVFNAIAEDKPGIEGRAYIDSVAHGIGQQFLEKFTGTWDVEKKFYSRDGTPRVTTLQCRQTMINDGRFLKSEFFEQSQTNTIGIGFIGFETVSGEFTSVWMDSHSSKMSVRRSRVPFDGKEIVLFSVALGSGEREGRPTRDVTRLVEDGEKILHRQYAINPDNTEQLRLELIMTKKTR